MKIECPHGCPDCTACRDSAVARRIATIESDLAQERASHLEVEIALRADLAEARTELESHANQELSWKTLVDSLRADLARARQHRDALEAHATEFQRQAEATQAQLRADLTREKAAHEEAAKLLGTVVCIGTLAEGEELANDPRHAATDAILAWRCEALAARADLARVTAERDEARGERDAWMSMMHSDGARYTACEIINRSASVCSDDAHAPACDAATALIGGEVAAARRDMEEAVRLLREDMEPKDDAGIADWMRRRAELVGRLATHPTPEPKEPTT